MLLRLFWRARQAPAYAQRIPERFGVSHINPAPGGLWIHAVSVGETLAIAPTIKTLLDRWPERLITVTTTTPTGSGRVAALFGDKVEHTYAPYDWPPFVWFFLWKAKPRLAIVVETELWPVTLILCKLMGTRVLIANARLSAKSAAGYQKIRWLIEPALKDVSIAAQHENDAARFLNLGADAQLVQVTGSVKFDIEVNDQQRARAMDLKAQLIATHDNLYSDASMRFIWIAASTHEGEDDTLLRAHKQILEKHPDCLLVLAPRHPERFESVAKKVKNLGLALSRRSEGRNPLVSAEQQVLILDTMGELTDFYGVADIAFVGGSLVPVGGHNYLEASIWGLPVLSGPHRHNFLVIANELEAIGGLTVATTIEEIAAQLLIAIERPDQTRKAGNRIIDFLHNNRGASEKLLQKIESLCLDDSQ